VTNTWTCVRCNQLMEKGHTQQTVCTNDKEMVAKENKTWRKQRHTPHAAGKKTKKRQAQKHDNHGREHYVPPAARVSVEDDDVHSPLDSELDPLLCSKPSSPVVSMGGSRALAIHFVCRTV